MCQLLPTSDNSKVTMSYTVTLGMTIKLTGLKLDDMWAGHEEHNKLDTVRTMYHLVIYMQSNKIHKVF